MLEIFGLKISWLGHDGFRIKDSKTVYIDPFRIRGGDKAGLLLITHEHFDHCSADDIRKVASSETEVMTIPACRGELSGLNLKGVSYVKPGDKLSVQGIDIEAVPAYNINKFREPGRVFHPKEDGKVGFILTMGKVRVYHTGDSDVIPEMDSIRAEVALLPVSGVYVMTAEEAAQAAAKVKPKVAIPMHYGTIVGDVRDAERFKRLAPCEVHILTKE